MYWVFRCGCEECSVSRSEDSLRHSRSRINAYRALASPSLIALSSKDPILTAFELSWELKQLAFDEYEFKSEYLVGHRIQGSSVWGNNFLSAKFWFVGTVDESWECSNKFWHNNLSADSKYQLKKPKIRSFQLISTFKLWNKSSSKAFYGQQTEIFGTAGKF